MTTDLRTQEILPRLKLNETDNDFAFGQSLKSSVNCETDRSPHSWENDTMECSFGGASRVQLFSYTDIGGNVLKTFQDDRIVVTVNDAVWPPDGSPQLWRLGEDVWLEWHWDGESMLASIKTISASQDRDRCIVADIRRRLRWSKGTSVTLLRSELEHLLSAID